MSSGSLWSHNEQEPCSRHGRDMVGLEAVMAQVEIGLWSL